MYKYRAVHRPNEPFWNIEICDTDSEVTYDLYDNGDAVKFLTLKDAESYIKNITTSEEEYGEWFNGPV